MDGWPDGWLLELRFYVLVNSISVIMGQWKSENEKLCAVETGLQLKGFLPTAGLEPETQ